MKDATTHPLFISLNEKHRSGKEVTKDEISSAAWHMRQDGYFPDQNEAVVFIHLRLGTNPAEPEAPVTGMAKRVLEAERERDAALEKFDAEMAAYVGLVQQERSVKERLSRAEISLRTLIQFRDGAKIGREEILKWPETVEWTPYIAGNLRQQMHDNTVALGVIERMLEYFYPVAIRAHEARISDLEKERAEIAAALAAQPRPEAPASASVGPSEADVEKDAEEAVTAS